MPTTDYSFGNWVKRRRKALDLTQQELAKRVGCSMATIVKIESDERRPSRQVAELLAQHLEIPADQREQFLKVARKEKASDLLGEIESAGQSFIQRKSAVPQSPGVMIGREFELAEINRLLEDPKCRLLTLTGPGGVGKTRLALEAAHQLRDSFDYGACFVSLVGTSASEFIVPAIADALGFVFSGATELKMQLFNHLREKRLLLVLDNLEHLLEGIELLAELLESTPDTKLLTTSREQLNLRAEWTFEVQGLPVPSDLELGTLESNSAAALFLQRARQANVNYSPAPEDLPAIMRICQLVAGLPLALELAAAWMRSLSCREIAREIENSLDFLAAAARDVPTRHRSMRAVFDYSWSLLTVEERRAMMMLSVFKGGFTRGFAEHVADAGLPLLSALVDKSLIQYRQDERYDLHELVRQYAHEKLLKAGRLGEVSDRHFEAFLALAEESRSELRGAGQFAWLNRLEQDHDNLRAALEWSLRHEPGLSASSESDRREAQKSLRLASTLYLFWKIRVHWSEGCKWLQRALAKSEGFPVTRERIRAINAAALLAVEQADTRTAQQLAGEALALAREIGEPYIIARAQNTLGIVLWKQKEFAAARSHCEQALAQFHDLGRRIDVADSLQALGRIATNQHDLESAQSWLEECLKIFQELESHVEYNAALSDLGLIAYLKGDLAAARSYQEKSLQLFREAGSIAGAEMSLNRLGDVARCEGNYSEAERYYTESLAIYRETNDKDEIPSLLHNLGYVSKYFGDYPHALVLFREGLAMHIETGNKAGIAECLMGIASVLLVTGKAENAARLFGTSEALRETLGAVLWPANRMENDRDLALLRKSLKTESLASAWAYGGNMSMEQAIAESMDQS